MLGILGLVTLILGVLVFYGGRKSQDKKRIALGLIVFILSLIYVIPEFAGDFINTVIENNK